MTTYKNDTRTESEELRIRPCTWKYQEEDNETEIWCLQDYKAYSISETDEISRELVITYETTDSLPPDNLTFEFPLTQSAFIEMKGLKGSSFV